MQGDKRKERCGGTKTNRRKGEEEEEEEEEEGGKTQPINKQTNSEDKN